MSGKLRNDIQNGKRPQFERIIYSKLPKEEDHKDHVNGEVHLLYIIRVQKIWFKFINRQINKTYLVSNRMTVIDDY